MTSRTAAWQMVDMEDSEMAGRQAKTHSVGGTQAGAVGTVGGSNKANEKYQHGHDTSRKWQARVEHASV